MANTPDRWRRCFRTLTAVFAALFSLSGSGASAFGVPLSAPSNVRSEQVDADNIELIPASFPAQRKAGRPGVNWRASEDLHSRVEKLFAAVTRLAPLPRRVDDRVNGGVHLRC
jgi:hypothetical protein